jgi:hypothetical protein
VPFANLGSARCGYLFSRSKRTLKGNTKIAMTVKPQIPHLPKIRIRKLVALPLFGSLFLTIYSSPTFGNEIRSMSGATSVKQTSKRELAGRWHFLRTHNPDGSSDAISIMHTAEPLKSDLDLVGIMIRCGKPDTETLIVLLRPFSVRARPRVAISQNGDKQEYETRVVAPGTALLLPVNATALVTGPWQNQSELAIRIFSDPMIRGVVSLKGLQSAFQVLKTSCATR